MVKPTNANSEIEVINDGTMIKFKDVESYENALLKVSAMSTSEQVSFLNSLSFTFSTYLSRSSFCLCELTLQYPIIFLFSCLPCFKPKKL